MAQQQQQQHQQLTTVQSKGIYHGLPTFPEDIKGLTAIVTGANGISGYHMIKVLAQSPQRWRKIYCLSRRPPAVPGGLPEQAEFISLDFLEKPEVIADGLRGKGVKADYVFFFSYIQAKPKEGGGLWSDAEEMVRVNKLLLSNFLEALPKAAIEPKHIMLQTGAKNYGIHLGPGKLPQRESDPRVTLEPNFYYPQEDDLAAFATKHSLKYSLVMPCAIVGAVPDAAMNIIYPLAVYATVQAHLGHKLEFPGDLVAWERPCDMSSATLNAYLEEWCALRDQKSLGEKWNAADGSAFTWGAFWPRLAAWYGIEYAKPNADASAYQSRKTAYDPPPRGFGPGSTYRFAWTFTQWAKDPSIQETWIDLSKKHGLQPGRLEDIDRVFGFLDGMLSPAPLYYSFDKARKNGFFGTVNSEECILEVFEDFAKLKMIPPVPMVGGGFE